jgi:hypothetical protein
MLIPPATSLQILAMRSLTHTNIVGLLRKTSGPFFMPLKRIHNRNLSVIIISRYKSNSAGIVHYSCAIDYSGCRARFQPLHLHFPE